ncbi:LysM peptidoglycan-binding domain-containing protein [Oceanobacter mangrovi]|uniref:LysM peptidoglycan-binding domain-containing protein n=1 Tax=Oceanobacter mangrovi TaxID=2862510 RepID=UPI001C8D7F32|nr:LysM peptidoglycan-binding domain-containing protein [Oceanobacter mangrovi]
MQADKNIHYTVKKGDCLWDLSQRFYQDPTLWPVIFNYNNQPRVVCETGTVIVDPDLILVGQKLVIPAANKAKAVDRNKMLKVRDAIIANRREHSGKGVQESRQIDRMRCTQPAPPKGGEPMARKKASVLAAPAVEVDLGKIQYPDIRRGGLVIKVTIDGKVLVRTTFTPDFQAAISDSGSIKLSASREAETVVGKLVNDTSFKIDTDSSGKPKGITLSNGLSTHFVNENTTIKVETTTDLWGNVGIKGSASFKTRKEFINNVATEETITISVEIEKENFRNRNSQSHNDEKAQLESELADLAKAGTLVLQAGAIIGVAILTDIIIPGLGFADDIVAIATAARLVTLAYKLGRGPVGRILYKAFIQAEKINIAVRENILSALKWLGLGVGIATPAMAMSDDQVDLIND